MIRTTRKRQAVPGGRRIGTAFLGLWAGSLAGFTLLLPGCAMPAGVAGAGGERTLLLPRPAEPQEGANPDRPGERGGEKERRERQPAAGPPEVVILAGGESPLLYRTPIDFGAARDVIGPEEVRESGAINCQELLRRTPGAHFFEETGTDAKPNIAFRGVTSGSEGTARSANVSLLADGIPLAPAPYGHAGHSLFPFTLERVHAVDILRGGRTVRYGPNTVSGIINFLTRPIPEKNTLEQNLKVDSYGDFSSYTGAGGRYDRFGIWAEAVYQAGSTYRDHGDYTIQNYAIKSSYDFSEKLQGFFQLDYYDDDSDLADGLSLAAFRRDPEQSQSYANRFEGDQLRGNFALKYKLDRDNRLDFSGYAFTGDRTFYLGKPLHYGRNWTSLIATPRPMTVWALQAQYERDYRLAAWEGELAVGLRYHQEDVARKKKTILPGGSTTLNYDNRYDYYTGSAYVENTLRRGRLTLTPGVRLERVDMDGKSDKGASVNRNFTEVLPALSGSYMLTYDWALYTNIQSSFRPPQANHIELDESSPQNLEAQYAWTYEIGTRGTFLDGLLSPDLTAYWIDYKERIERDPDRFDVFYNTGDTRHRGLELTLDSDLQALDRTLRGWELQTNFSYNDSSYANGEYDGNRVPHAPHWMGAWAVKYDHPDSGFWGVLDGCFVGSAYSDADNTQAINAEGTRGKRPSYTVWNARVGWQHPLGEGVRLRAQVGCINLFDEEYFEVRAGKGLFLGPPLGVYTQVGITAEF